ncbi:hypothetical protein PROFUN_07969, partial [Planoprotostelium fungivorum]
KKDEDEPTLGWACCYLEKWLDGSSSNGGIQTKDQEWTASHLGEEDASEQESNNKTKDSINEGGFEYSMECDTQIPIPAKDLEQNSPRGLWKLKQDRITTDAKSENKNIREAAQTRGKAEPGSRITCLGLSSAGYIVALHDCNRWLLQESVAAECPYEELMAEAEEEGFSNYRVVNPSTSPPPNMPPKAFETLQILHRRPRTMVETRREQMSYITQTASAGQQACLREEGASISNINKAFLDAAKDIIKNN